MCGRISNKKPWEGCTTFGDGTSIPDHVERRSNHVKPVHLLFGSSITKIFRVIDVTHSSMGFSFEVELDYEIREQGQTTVLVEFYDMQKFHNGFESILSWASSLRKKSHKYHSILINPKCTDFFCHVASTVSEKNRAMERQCLARN